MTKHRSLALWLFSLPLVLLAVNAGAQSVPLDIEVGYRWTDIEGNEDLYRTQINEGNGPMIRSLSFFTSDFDGKAHGIIDHLGIEGTDLGVGPAQSLRLDMGKANTYRLRAGYRLFDAFNALPTVANPFLADGVVPGQHTLDRKRMMIDADLDILAFEHFTPFAGYSYGEYDGPGTSTYYLGTDEFRMDSDLHEVESEVRLGTGFNFKRLYGSVLQGWRDVESDESLTLTAPGTGNNNFPILGRNVSAEQITRKGFTENDAPFTNVYLGSDFGRVHLVGTYVSLTGDAQSKDTESATGSFVSFPIARYFNGLSETITSSADTDMWRGGVRAEIAASNRVDFLVGYNKEYRNVGGTTLIDTLFRDSITFGGGLPGDFREILEAESSFESDIATIEGAMNFRIFPSLTFRFGASNTNYDYLVVPDVLEMPLPDHQGGSLGREVNAFDASINYADEMFSFLGSIRREDANDPVLRTDFVDRNRVRARLGFVSPAKKVHITISGEDTDADNESRDAGFDSNTRAYSIDGEIAPWETFRLRGAYSTFRYDSTITYRRPETFALGVSELREDVGATEVGIVMAGNPVAFEASAARVESTRSIEYMSHRFRARLSYQFIKSTSVAAEWARDEYEEEIPTDWNHFNGNRFGIFFRFRQQ